MKTGAQLLTWARGMYMEWWERRHENRREPAEEVIARAYLQGGIDALNDEVARNCTPIVGGTKTGC